MDATLTDTPFLQAVHHQPPAEPTGMRFFEDGRMEVLNARPLVGVTGGTPPAVGSGWHEIKRMGPAQVRALEAAVREEGFFGLPDRIEPSGTSLEGGIWVWMARIDGVEHTVVLSGTPYARSAVIDRLFAKVQTLPFMA